jgi:hypothetical protein
MLFQSAIDWIRDARNDQDTNLLRILLTRSATLRHDPEYIRLALCNNQLMNLDKLFSQYLEEVQMDKLTTANGVRMRQRHSLVEKWPYRITETTSKEAFNLLCAAGHSGLERYVEIERAE